MAKHDNHNSHTSQWGMAPNGAPDAPTPPPMLSVDDALMQDPSAKAFMREVAPIDDRFAAMPPKLAELLYGMHQKLAVNELDPNLSAAGRGSGETDIRRQALEAIEPIWSDAQSTAAKLEDLVDVATTGPTMDAAERLILEQQIGRSWARVLRRLDAADSSNYGQLQRIVETFATAAAESEDRAMLLALRQELPDYLASIKVAGLYGNGGVEAMLDRIEMPLQSPKARAARQVERQAREGWTRLVQAFAMARSNASSGDGNVILPGWAKNETLSFGRYVVLS